MEKTNYHNPISQLSLGINYDGIGSPIIERMISSFGKSVVLTTCIAKFNIPVGYRYGHQYYSCPECVDQGIKRTFRLEKVRFFSYFVIVKVDKEFLQGD